jgi:hypothetical protein
VAFVVYSLMLSGPFRQGEDSPVVETSDCAAAAEDERAGRSCDSVIFVRLEIYMILG